MDAPAQSTTISIDRLTLLTLREVADLLHVSYWTVWRLVRAGEGELPSVLVSKQGRRISAAALLEYVEKRSGLLHVS